MKTFIVKREVYYTITAENEFHASNKVSKLNTDIEYANENPVSDFIEKTEIAAVISI